jgi:hypothetical protein
MSDPTPFQLMKMPSLSNNDPQLVEQDNTILQGRWSKVFVRKIVSESIYDAIAKKTDTIVHSNEVGQN